MSNELADSYVHGATCYFLMRDARNNNNVVQGQLSGIQSYATSNYSGYPINATEQGTASSFYVGNVPTWLPAGTYNVVMKSQLGANPVETDPTVGVGSVDWNGSTIAELSDTATSGQVASFAPIRIARGVAINNFTFYLVSSADHVTPLTSGICSGQISRDAGAFGPLQSGAFTELGKGFYAVQALTSGDLLCNTAGLLFTATALSGAASDPRAFTLVTQKVSGQ